MTRPINSIGIVGGGLIGLSWAALFSSFGHRVVIQDPRDDIAAALDAFLADAWPVLADLGMMGATPPVRPGLTTDLADFGAVDFVQECAPDRIEVKQAVVADLERHIADDAIIASSTSSLLPSDIQANARRPGRILVAHPMNPPHLVPMVELVAGRHTAPATIDRAEAFYSALHRVPIRVKKEVVGHLANRLTSALYREAVHIAAQGIADVADIDRAIAYGPGLRWALIGPHLTYHLGGGAGGYAHYLDHLGPTQEARWQDLGTTPLTPQVKALLVRGVEAELVDQDQSTLVARRDAALAAILKIKKTHGL